MPLRLWRYPDGDKWFGPPEWRISHDADSNRDAAYMMISTDPDKGDRGLAPLEWNVGIGKRASHP